MKNFLFNSIKWIQKIFISLLLTLVYFTGVGITSFFSLFFHKSLNKKEYTGTDTYWVKAADYENKEENYIHQS